MTPINGKVLANTLREKIRQDVAQLPSPPGLAVLLVGEDPASHLYVNLKEKAAQEAGIRTDIRRVPVTTPDDELEAIVRAWNTDTAIDAILIQLPLPAGHDTDRLVAAMDPAKDVDGFHPATTVISPVHAAVLYLIGATGLDPRTKAATILTNSDTFSAPLARLLQRAGFITAIMHPDILDGDVLRTSDVIISAVGRPGIIGPDLIKSNAVLIDVGTTKDAYGRLRGDMDAEALQSTPGHLTPVPGGVGPMTVALLLQNVLQLHDNRRRS